MSERRWTTGGRVAAVFVVAVALRAGPLHESPLPFNPDGIIYAGTVRATRGAGELPLAGMAVDELQFTALLALVSEVTGEPALYIAQPAMAVVGAVPVLVAAAVVRRLLARLGGSGWPPVTDAAPELVAPLAAALLAVSGLTLHRAMAVDEQTAGLLFVPLAVVAFARARRSGRPAWYVAAVSFAVVLPPTHNLDAVLFGLFLVVWAAIEIATRPAGSRVGDAAAAASYWGLVLGYFLLVERLTAARIVQSGRLTDALDLFFAWVLLVAIAAPVVAGLRARLQRIVGLVGVGLCFGLLAINAAVPVFPGMPDTATPLLVALLPLVVPSMVAVYALPVGTAEDCEGRALFALGAAVALVIGFSLTAALTPPYLNTLYRVQTFLHLPWAVFAALAIGVWMGRDPTALGRRLPRALPQYVAVVLVVCAAVSIPVAFAGSPMVPYTGVTEEAELTASGHAIHYVQGPWATDDHLSRIGGYHRQGSNTTVEGRSARGQVSPVYTWLAGGSAPDCPVLTQRSWTTTGAQFFPKAPLTLSTDQYRIALNRRHVVYTTGGPDPVRLSLPRTPRGTGC